MNRNRNLVIQCAMTCMKAVSFVMSNSQIQSPHLQAVVNFRSRPPLPSKLWQMNTQHLGGGETWLKAFCSLAEDRLSTRDQIEYKTKDRFLSLLVLISYTRKQCLMTHLLRYKPYCQCSVLFVCLSHVTSCTSQPMPATLSLLVYFMTLYHQPKLVERG